MRLLFASILLSITVTLSAQHWSELHHNSSVKFSEVEARYDQQFSESGFDRSTGWKQFGRLKYFMDGRLDENGHFVQGDATFNAYNDYLDQNNKSKLKDRADWSELGPTQVPVNGGAGRINCIAFDPTNANTFYVGSPSGGLWKTTTGGNSWNTTTDHLSSIGISDIIIDPIDPNIIIVASGDMDASDTYSAGILRSTDGGLTWNTTSLIWTAPNQKQANSLAMDPADHNTLLAATSSGLYKSTDNGLSWLSIKVGNYKKVAFHPTNNSIIYLKTSSQLFRSDNSGLTFNNLITPTYSTSVGRIDFALSADAPDNVYIVAAKSGSWALEGIYVSTDKGANYSKALGSYPNLLDGTTTGSGSTGQAWYDLAIAVSPLNKDQIYVGGINIWRSTNGGSAWTQVAHWTGNGGNPYVHADIHGLEFTSNGNLYACTDGGIYKTINMGSSWGDLSDGLAISQMYKLGVSQTDPDKIITGWQDNGSNLMTNPNWKRVLGGDGMECIINPVNANYMFASLYYGDIRRSATGGTSFSPITNTINETGAWVTPYVLDPNNSTTIYAGFSNVWKGTNYGNYWTKISSFNNGANKLETIAVAPSSSNTIYTATSSSIFVTHNGGTNWNNITSGINGYGNITSIIIDPSDENHVWISKSGYFSHKKVYESIDGGTNWINISGTLPNLPVNTLVYKKNSDHGIYAGLDVGVYYRDTVLDEWIPFMANLPNVIVRELEIIESTSELVAATYGRGLWKTRTWDLLNSSEQNLLSDNSLLKVFPVPSEGSINVDLSAFADQSITLEITNTMGQVVISKSYDIPPSLLNFDLGEYGKGLYFVSVIGSKYRSSSRILIQ